jgi:hypothetical protein
MADLVEQWRPLSNEVLSGMAEWRQQHPRATLAEIETALDERLNRLRAQMLQDAALTSPAADWPAASPCAPPSCPTCATPLQGRGSHPRHLQTLGGQEVILTRQYGTCPRCGAGLFPPR